MELKDANVLVLGVAYRGCEGGEVQSRGFYHWYFEARMRRVYAYDSLFGDEVRQFGAEPRKLGDVEDIDAVVIASDYKEFKKIEWSKLGLRHKVLMDGRQVIDKEKIRKYGFIYYGIGIL